jgi:His/Glu/Gln/Arg/opine family amino acid ABC transporter permease subunit
MENVVSYLPLLLAGLKITLLLALTTVVVGLCLGMLLALAKLSPRPWLSRPVFALTNFLRGIPEFLILLVVFYGGAQVLSDLAGEGGTPLNISPFGAGVFALSIVFGSYASETFRAAFLSVPKGQVEAGLAYGFTPFQIFRYVQLPQIWRVALPGIANLWQGLVKDTALVSIVGLDDLMRKTNQAAQTTREPFTFYLVAALIFLAVTLVSMAFFAWMERRSSRGVRRAR